MASTSRSTGKEPSGAPRRRRMSAMQRREEILVAAMEVFSEHGFEQTAIDRVAEAAGVSKALIYEHFTSKTELQATLVRQLTSELVADIISAVEAASTDDDADSRDRLRAGLDAYFRFVEKRRGAWHMLFRESIAKEAGDVVLSVERAVSAAIVDVLSEAPETVPLLGDVEAGVRLRVAAQMLTGAMQWVGNWWVDNLELAPREKIVEWTLDAMWLGLDGWTTKLLAQKQGEAPGA